MTLVVVCLITLTAVAVFLSSIGTLRRTRKHIRAQREQLLSTEASISMFHEAVEELNTNLSQGLPAQECEHVPHKSLPLQLIEDDLDTRTEFVLRLKREWVAAIESTSPSFATTLVVQMPTSMRKSLVAADLREAEAWDEGLAEPSIEFGKRDRPSHDAWSNPQLV